MNVEATRAAIRRRLIAELEKQLADAEVMLRDKGATDIEVEETIAWSRAESVAAIDKQLPDVLRSLSDWDAPSGRLQ